MAQAPPANVVTAEDRSGSPARSRGTCQRAPGPPSGSTTRNEITARPGSAAKRLETCDPSCRSGNQPSSSRKSTTSPAHACTPALRSEEHTSELQSRVDLVCRLLLEKKKTSGSPSCFRRYRESRP